MKKTTNIKKSPAKKTTEKGKDSGELRKPATLKPIKEKEKKNWKNNIDDDDDDFALEEDVKLDTNFDDDEEEEEFYDDNF